jgi:hypothetical protein
MTYRPRDLAYLVVAVVFGIGIYFMFRAMYMAEQPLPFAQEMTLVFLGGVVMIALTAALLNRQTDLELRKEGTVRVLNHQLAVVASEEVVTRFEAVLDALLSDFADGALSGADGEKVMQSVADLTTAMRSDVLQNTALTSTNAASAIRQNSRRMEQLDDLNFEAGVATKKKENSNARS